MPLALSLCDSNSSVFSTVLKLGFSFPFTVTQTFTSFGYRLVYLLPFPLFPRTFSRDSLPLRLPVFSFFCFNCSPLNAACAFLSFVFVFLTIPQRALSGLPYPTGHPQVTSFFFFFYSFPSFVVGSLLRPTPAHTRVHNRTDVPYAIYRYVTLCGVCPLSFSFPVLSLATGTALITVAQNCRAFILLLALLCIPPFSHPFFVAELPLLFSFL